MNACSFCEQPVDIENENTYREVSSWVNGPKLDGPKLREQTGRFAHPHCVENLVAGQSVDQPELFDEVNIDIAHVVWSDGKCRISTNGQGHFPCSEHEPILSDEVGKVTKLTGLNSAHQALKGAPTWGGNGDVDCVCHFSPHREDCPRFGR